MSSTEPKRPWEDRVKEAGERAQEELRRVLEYIDKDVVPEVRRSGSAALRSAAERMQKLAQHLDEEAHGHADEKSGDR
jgi:hypothetical protein